jgi:hypothetical protein
MKGGVLVIGSLLWQDHLKSDDKDNIRKLWREEHLLVSRKIMVKAPIRYGRLSNDDIYTMTFSNSVAKSKMGTAYFVPFQQQLAETFEDIVNQSKEISIAEGMNGQFIKKKQSGEIWCVLGILLNPKTVNKEKAEEIYNKWSDLIRNEGGFNPKDFKIGEEKSCFKSSGKLNFDWPTTLDIRDEDLFNGYDFIIATGTKPSKYPNIEELMNKVKADKKRYYFIENYKSGISTFQDHKIINKL